jgi:hypothetical protein
MQWSVPKAVWNVCRAWWRAAALFAACWLYLWLRVDPSALYFWPSETLPPYSTGSAFLRAFLTYPGGAIEYASAFACQFYYYAWAGALIGTVAAALTCLGTRAYIVAVAGSPPRWLHLVPGVLSLVVWNRYAYDLASAGALLAALWSACVYLRCRRAAWVRLPSFLILMALVYYVAGGASLLYTVFCATGEVLTQGGLLWGLAYLPVGAVVPFLSARLVFDVSPADAYARLLPFYQAVDLPSSIVMLCACAFPPVAAAASALWRGRARAASAPPVPVGARGWSSSLAGAFASAVLLVAAGCLVWFTFDRQRNAYLELGRYASLKEWPALLRRARDIPRDRYDALIGYDVNRALYHSGRLLDEMFSYPQRPSALLAAPLAVLESPGPAPFRLMKSGEILFDLGSVNESEHMAHEVLSILGGRPFVLERLVLIGIAKGQTEVARLYLHALSKDVIYGRWAAQCLRRLQADPLLTGDAEVERLRSLMPVRDDARDASVEMLLERLLERDKQNRMALEYLMAYHLLNRRVDRLAWNISRLGDLGYGRIPRYCEEGILIYQARTGQEVDLRGRSISAETLERFRGFNEALARCGGDVRVARSVLAKEFGNSYFFYYKLGPGQGSP